VEISGDYTGFWIPLTGLISILYPPQPQPGPREDDDDDDDGAGYAEVDAYRYI